MNTRLGAVALFIAGLLTSFSASADTFNWSKVDPTYGLLAGQASFTISSDTNTSDCGAATCYFLVISISNTTSNQVSQSSQVLNGLFFDATDNGTGAELASNLGMANGYATGGLLPSSGTTITPGSDGTNSSICSDSAQGTALASQCNSVFTKITGKNTNYLGWEVGVDSAGLKIPSTGTTTFTEKYYLADAGWGDFHDVGNPQLGIVPTVGTSNGNGGLSNDFPLTYKTATFYLYGLKTNNLTIKNVEAAYGTAPEALVAASDLAGPEPSTVVLVAGALVLLLARKRRRA